jgi:hypothetical protein
MLPNPINPSKRRSSRNKHSPHERKALFWHFDGYNVSNLPEREHSLLTLTLSLPVNHVLTKLNRYLIYLGLGLTMMFGKPIGAFVQKKREEKRMAKEQKEKARNQTIIHILKPEGEESPKLTLSGEWWCRYI